LEELAKLSHRFRTEDFQITEYRSYFIQRKGMLIHHASLFFAIILEHRTFATNKIKAT